MLTFAHAWMLALLPLPWLVRIVLPPVVLGRVAVRVPFGERIRAATEGAAVSRATRKVLGQAARTVTWLLVLTALARPQWIGPPVTRNQPARDLFLLVDLSGSMRQEDFTNAVGAKVDRLAAVKEVLGDFLTRRHGDRVGLIVFGDSPFLQSPFSADLGLSRRLLEETAIGMAGPRTAFGDAIGLALSVFERSDAPAKTIIALTDGNDTASQVPPPEAARVAQERGIRIHAVAIGDPTTLGEEKLDTQTLRSVAQCSGGSYFFAAERQELARIYAELDQIETRQVKVLSHRPRTELYFWPLVAAVAVWLIEKIVVVLSQGRALDAVRLPVSVRVNRFTARLEVVT